MKVTYQISAGLLETNNYLHVHAHLPCEWVESSLLLIWDTSGWSRSRRSYVLHPTARNAIPTETYMLHDFALYFFICLIVTNFMYILQAYCPDSCKYPKLVTQEFEYTNRAPQNESASQGSDPTTHFYIMGVNFWCVVLNSLLPYV